MAGAPPPQGQDDDPRLLSAQFEMVQRELNRVQQHLADLQDALTQTQQAASTVRSLAEAKGAQESLVPIGAGIHVRAKVDPTQLVLIPIGAGYATEDTMAGAGELLGKRVEQLAASFQQATQEAERLARAAGALSEKLISLSQDGP